jgi:hypothetical protein
VVAPPPLVIPGTPQVAGDSASNAIIAIIKSQWMRKPSLSYISWKEIFIGCGHSQKQPDKRTISWTISKAGAPHLTTEKPDQTKCF